ncbi:hypothetical protein MNEG_1068 [Monoraphidium neglectum]|uniref:Uncharacterized protein n=1 Tax=Monoraphidium neglectum TaxID=145388 RepID=A0A0D2NRE2_9CHLO|nr:hypothetical protein MNEG_1068 [Monoraphidium neglectum]KIZ06876.1 hypothetical protein MNEG_1068 [Monoraphidium neglectum]|eukprot:XP_013905895.1 hypothetical protein MNEG_1068 [Monoraphidium neglectum]
MQALAERARQGLGIGSASFEPTCLDRYHKSLASCEAAAGWLLRYKGQLDAFRENGAGFLSATGKLITDCPMPEEFTQDSETQRVEALPPLTPPEAHRRLFDLDLQAALAEQVPGSFSAGLDREVALPINMWLHAFRSAKERLLSLERRRLVVDAQRRQVERRAARARGHFTKEADARADLDVTQKDQDAASATESEDDEAPADAPAHATSDQPPSIPDTAGTKEPFAPAGAAAVGGAAPVGGAGGHASHPFAGGRVQRRAERVIEKHRRRGVKELQAACERANRKLAPLISDFEVEEERLQAILKWRGASALAPPEGLLPEFPAQLLEVRGAKGGAPAF